MVGEKALDLYNRAVTLEESGDSEDAIAALNEAIRIEPNFAEAYCLRGSIYRTQRRDPNKAIPDYGQAIAFGADDNNILRMSHHERGLCLCALNLFGEAVSDFTKAIDLAPDDALSAETYFYRAGAYHKTEDDLDKTIADLRQAITLKPDYAEAQNALDTILREKEQREPSAKIKRSLIVVFTLGIASIPFSDVWWHIKYGFKDARSSYSDGEYKGDGKGCAPLFFTTLFHIVFVLVRWIIPYMVCGFIFHVFRLIYLLIAGIVKAIKGQIESSRAKKAAASADSQEGS